MSPSSPPSNFRHESFGYVLLLTFSWLCLQTVVLTAIDMRDLAKLKFKRGASVTLVLRDGDVREFLTPQVMMKHPW